MNAPHKDIDKIIPFGEFLRGFINQRYITATDIARILRERGIFVFNQDKITWFQLCKIYYCLPLNLTRCETLFLKRKIMRKSSLEK